ncbi:MAG: RagB/SusD family nutrient uptake outer membrane protein [Bacteroidales bacterium]|nr:RagB/SusD family nutrient uptake outer membrane protein [Bacteroidales bacterium]
MKTLKYILGVLAACAALSSCVGDLNVTPIDPNANTVDKVLTSQAAMDSYIAGVYLGFATSGYYGKDGDANISNVDGGASQYIRGLYHHSELTTDESVCGWNDQTIKDFHWMNWTTADTFIYAFWSRIFMQVASANEFIRQMRHLNGVDETLKARYVDEARVLRAIAYYHAIDNFGNVPFVTDEQAMGAIPEQISRADLYAWLEKELKDIIAAGRLPEGKAVTYGHAGMGAAKFLLAKLYLNAEVFSGTAQWQKCADVLKDLMDDGYSLHTSSAGKYSAYQELFLADNDRCTDEIIFAIEQDGLYITSYGVTNYLIFASTGGHMNVKNIGISSGWAGLRTTAQFYDKFTESDARNLFYTTDKSMADINAMPEKPEDDPDKYDEAKLKELKDSGTYEDEVKKLKDAKEKAIKQEYQKKDVDDIGSYYDGYGFMKFLNMKSDGTPAKEPGSVDTDFPMMRYADVLLMAAECQLRGASIDGLAAYNQVRQRAGVPTATSITLQDVLDERGRELYQECWRRNDLVRFGQFTSDKYLWQWKGNVRDGRAVEEYRNLFPIPDSDRQANSNLVQNAGY